MSDLHRKLPPLEKGRSIRKADRVGIITRIEMTRFDRTKVKTARARLLRRNGTKPEAKLWTVLRGTLFGISFRRQHPLGPYILDFYCPVLKLAIELDGDQHCSRLIYDERRTRFLKSKGIRMIRFWNIEVNENFDGVCEGIAAVIQKLTPTRNASRSDLPLSGRGKECREPTP